MSSSSRSRGLALGLLAGCLLDAVFADPRRWHPVAGFGRVAGLAERRLYADSRAAGAGHALVCVGAAVAAARVAAGRRPGALAAAAATWAVLGGTSLRRQGRALAAEIDRGDLGAARARLPALCGRDPSTLDGPRLARAGVESIAENTGDAVVAPLLWGAVAGVPGLVAYRAVNTLDAMVGHHSARYERFGWAAARLDDAANWVPSRVGALLACACAPLVGGSPWAALRVALRDGSRHPSPNAGQLEAAFAGALGVRLGGPLHYPYGAQQRPVLGAEGRSPDGGDLARAAALSGAVTAAAALLAAGARLLATRHHTRVA